MQKIISVFLMLVLVSGCDKVNSLRNAPPVGSQDNQLVQSQKNQTVKTGETAKTAELAKTVKQVGYIVVGVVLTFGILYAVYKGYRYFRPAETPPAEPSSAAASLDIDPIMERRLPGWNTFAKFIPDFANRAINSFLSQEELSAWKELHRTHSFPDSRQYCYEFLMLFYLNYGDREKQKIHTQKFTKLPPPEKFSFALEDFVSTMNKRLNK